MADNNVQYVVIGAGVSGLATAYRLSERTDSVLVLEKQDVVGGLCARIAHAGNTFDPGSHRIHEQCNPRIRDLLEDLLEERLLLNERGGKLRLLDTYVDYPITSLEMLRAIGLYRSFLTGCSLGWARARALGRALLEPSQPQNYERYLLDRAGERAYRLFYEPYARKVWGCEPSEISITAVKKRVSMTGPMSFLEDVVRRYLGLSEPRRYYYPRRGIGSIPRAFVSRVEDRGGRCLTGVRVTAIRSDPSGISVTYAHRGTRSVPETVRAEAVVSTIPVDELERLAEANPDRPAVPPPDPVPATGPQVGHGMTEGGVPLAWTGLRLAFLRLDTPLQLEGETFYFPELKYIFGRVSVPDRYSPDLIADGRHWVLCEVPCGAHRETPVIPSKQLIQRCFDDLMKADLVAPGTKVDKGLSFVVDLPKVYPVYRAGWQDTLRTRLETLAEAHPRLFSSGRPGLFLHNNLDQSIEIGLALGDHLMGGGTARAWYARLSEFHGMRLRD